MSSKSITDLAAAIAHNTQIVHDYFVANNLPLPTFDVKGPLTISIPPHEKEVAAAHAQVVADTQVLHNLMKGPTEMVMGIARGGGQTVSQNDILSLQAMRRFQVAEKFELDDKASFDSLAKACNVNVVDLRRLIRHAMSNHIFREEDGLVAHTAASRALRENKPLNSIVGIMTEEVFPGKANTINALVKHNGFHAPEQSGWSLGHNTDKGLYDELRQYPDRAKRFATAMSGFAARVPAEPLARGWDWASIDAAKGTVVDVGGGWGHVPIGLAKYFPNIKFIVQDFADVIAGGPPNVPEEIKDRIQYMEHNFLEEQPVKGKDVYFMRAILHNWPDEYCVKILRNLLPALNKDAHILINDAIIDPVTLDKFRRSMDLNMMTLFGSRERSLEEWESLVHQVDPKLSMKTFTLNPKGHVIDVQWAD